MMKVTPHSTEAALTANIYGDIIFDSKIVKPLGVPIKLILISMFLDSMTKRARKLLLWLVFPIL